MMLLSFRKRVWFAYFCIVHRRSLAAQRAWQERYLRKIVLYAYTNVPLWKCLLDERGVAPDAIQTLGDLSKLPVINKQSFVGKVVEDYIDSTRLTRSFWYVTSGTSGSPFTFMMSEHACDLKFVDFAILRFMWWRGSAYDRLSSVRLARIKIREKEQPDRLFVPVDGYLKDPAAAVHKIVAFNPEVLTSYPSILLDLARHLRDNPTLARPKPTYVLSFGETLAPSARSFITEILGTEVYDRYGLEEIGAVGGECSAHNGFHINTESVIVEVTDDSYEAVSEGTEGRLIMTDLFNTGMPFIRYDTEDRGVISYEPCVCGLQSPRLWIKGRYSAYLTFPERRIHHLEFDGAMDGFMNLILQYQIVKKSDTLIVARIIRGPAFRDDIQERVRSSLARVVGDAIRISVEIVAELPITERGKSRIVVDESGMQYV